MNYRHRQSGTLVVGALGVAAAGGLAGALLGGEEGRFLLPGIGLSVLFALLAVGFGSLTVEVDRESLRVGFGPGWVRRSWPVARIRGAEPIRCRAWWGWGIHRTPRGWLYNIAGLDAVEVKFDDGKAVLVGTDEPKELARALRKAAGIG